jgi:hypothetical protein
VDLINKGFDNVAKLNTFVYITTDNTVLHKNIFKLFEFNLLEKKCFTFNQDRQKNEIMLEGTINPLIEINMFLFYRYNYKDIKYDDCFNFINKCYTKDVNNYIYIDSTLAVAC